MAVDNLPDGWQVFPDGEQLAVTLVDEVLLLAKQAVAKHGAFHFITAGGTTPNRCYQLLAERQADWQSWHIYMGDERVLDVDNPERNSQALLQNWLKKSKIPVANWHFMKVEQGAETAAHDYADLFSTVSEFDLCLLGMGEDGHTASLFPGHNEAEHVEPIYCEAQDPRHAKSAPIIIEKHSPKPPSTRVSLNYVAFAKSRLVIKLITGASKQQALKSWLQESKPLPIALARGKQTKVYVSEDALFE